VSTTLTALAKETDVSLPELGAGDVAVVLTILVLHTSLNAASQNPDKVLHGRIAGTKEGELVGLVELARHAGSSHPDLDNLDKVLRDGNRNGGHQNRVTTLGAKRVDVVTLVLDCSVALLEDALDKGLVALALTGHVSLVVLSEAISNDLVLIVSKVARAASACLMSARLVVLRVKLMEVVVLANLGVLLGLNWSSGNRGLGTGRDLGSSNRGISDGCGHDLGQRSDALRMDATALGAKAARPSYDKVAADGRGTMRELGIVLEMLASRQALLADRVSQTVLDPTRAVLVLDTTNDNRGVSRSSGLGNMRSTTLGDETVLIDGNGGATSAIGLHTLAGM
jgi:hypothetical protein